MKILRTIKRFFNVPTYTYAEVDVEGLHSDVRQAADLLHDQNEKLAEKDILLSAALEKIEVLKKENNTIIKECDRLKAELDARKKAMLAELKIVG